jgi:hypothetical protein
MLILQILEHDLLLIKLTHQLLTCTHGYSKLLVEVTHSLLL